MAMYVEHEPLAGENDASDRSASFESGGPYATRPHAAHGITAAPRLTPINDTVLSSALAPSSQPHPHITIANLRFPADVVHTQAAAYADGARAKGAPHSMQLWRDGCHEALLRLSRTATQTPPQATCEALFWQLEGEDYYVSVTFAQPPLASHTRPIH